MARNGNTIYVNSTGSVVAKTNLKVAYVLFNANSAGDSFTLRDGSASGAIKIKGQVGTAADNNTLVLDFSRRPIVFPTSIHCSAIDSSCDIIIVTTEGGQ